MPAHEFPIPTEHVMIILFDLGMVLGLFGFRRAAPAPLFALRLGHHGWWTGQALPVA